MADKPIKGDDPTWIGPSVKLLASNKELAESLHRLADTIAERDMVEEHIIVLIPPHDNYSRELVLLNTAPMSHLEYIAFLQMEQHYVCSVVKWGEDDYNYQGEAPESKSADILRFPK